MHPHSTLFLLGADDPEMWHIESLLYACGLRYEYARRKGARVSPGTSYQADCPKLADVQTLVRIECEPLNLPDHVEVVIIDHHREGDPGFDLGPADFWEASSVGQTVRHIEKYLPKALATSDHARKERILRHIAAADHCLPALRAGLCPGIELELVANLQLHNIARGTGAQLSKVRGIIQKFERILANADTVDMGGSPVRDLTYYPLQGYGVDHLALREAGTLTQSPWLTRYRDRKNEREKIVLSGHLPAEAFAFFRNTWAPAQGLTDLYGVPKRGYAGGYLPH